MNASELLELAKKEINWGHGKCSKEYHTAIAPDKMIPLLERYLELEENLSLEVGVKVKRTERGWGGHFMCANRCLFRRNTLLEIDDIQIVVSTVGLMEDSQKEDEFRTIGWKRYFETIAFHADPKDARYHDADFSRQISFESEWAIDELDADEKANDMHEKVVKEVTGQMKKGERYD